MINKTPWSLRPQILLATAAVLAMTLSTQAVSTFLGPLNPGFENGGADWNSGATGSGTVDFVSFDNYDTNGSSAPGTNCVMQASDGSGQADLRANYFSLGASTQGTNAVSLDFDYYILGPINFGDQIRVGVRFEDVNGNFLGEHNFHLGTPNNDVGGTGWHHFHGVAADPTLAAVNMDVRITMNIFGDDTWSSGPVLYDNFVVAVNPAVGPNNNGDFEQGGANWNAGSSGAGASINFYYPSNGPSAPGTNCIIETSDGSANCDFRANNFWLGSATAGTNAVSVDFDYNILGPVNFGDNIRFDLRFEDSNGNFLGEYYWNPGTPTGDVGGDGWHHFHGVAADPTQRAVTADVDVSMGNFGPWSSGPVLFDNIAIKLTPAYGPNWNGDFERGEANWKAGGPGGSGGSETFYNPSNGWSEFGTNSVMMTADGTVAPPNGNDIRVNEFVIPNNAQTTTISFDYNIVNPITVPNQIRVGLRFFNSGNNFNGEHNTYIGTPNGDLGAQGWKHLSETYPVPAGSTYNDIRVSMNIFGDDVWNNGAVLFDNFVVINGTNTVPVANAFTMGTVTNLPVTRAAVTADQAGGIIESDGILVVPAVSYLTQPANGTVTAKKSNLTYTANNGYTGTDSFNFGVGDGIGGLSLGTESVQVNSNAGLNRFTNTVGSAAVFSGAPFCDYVLLMTSSLTPPVVWSPVSTNAADGSGVVNFTEPQTGSAGFVQTKLVP
jgi:Bacterial Ig domain